MPITDTLNRPLKDLRISVTDRCNFRCPYCMPKEVFGRDWQFLPRKELLNFEEITRLARLFATLGVSKIRLTGGEPLLRHDLPRLIAMLAAIPEIRDLTLTTNGSLLSRLAPELQIAGLQRITVSLDALDDRIFKQMSDVNFTVTQVLEGIAAAERSGLAPIKINMVVKRGVNDHEVTTMAAHFRGTGHIVRFIEYMDVGHSNGWELRDVVRAREIHDRIHAHYPLEPISANYQGEVANRYRYCDGQGEIGIIASVTQPFCRNCTRARLTADGQFYTCLFAAQGHDLRHILRNSSSDTALLNTLVDIWRQREDRYSERRSDATIRLKKVEMSRVGG